MFARVKQILRTVVSVPPFFHLAMRRSEPICTKAIAITWFFSIMPSASAVCQATRYGPDITLPTVGFTADLCLASDSRRAISVSRDVGDNHEEKALT